MLYFEESRERGGAERGAAIENLDRREVVYACRIAALIYIYIDIGICMKDGI